MAGSLTPENAWEKAIEFVLSEEGGFQTDPADPGNWTKRGSKGELRGTNFGISALSFPKLDIRGLKKNEAISIFKQNYWTMNNGRRNLSDMRPLV